MVNLVCLPPAINLARSRMPSDGWEWPAFVRCRERAKLINEYRERLRAGAGSDDEVASSLKRSAAEIALTASRITAIGAFSRVPWGYFDGNCKDMSASISTSN